MSRSESALSHEAATTMVVSGDRAESVVAFERAVVEFFVGISDLLGIPKSIAAIYAVIFASVQPLSFAEIEGRLNISKGSVSQGLRVLRSVGAVKEVSNKEDRSELFSPDLEMRRMIEHFLQHRLREQLDAGSARLGELTRLCPPGKTGAGDTLKKRIKKLHNWHSRLRALLPVARTVFKLTS